MVEIQANIRSILNCAVQKRLDVYDKDESCTRSWTILKMILGLDAWKHKVGISRKNFGRWSIRSPMYLALHMQQWTLACMEVQTLYIEPPCDMKRTYDCCVQQNIADIRNRCGVEDVQRMHSGCYLSPKSTSFVIQPMKTTMVENIMWFAIPPICIVEVEWFDGKEGSKCCNE